MISEKSSINLNGHRISSSISSPLFNVKGGNLTLKGEGTISARNAVASASDGGEVTVESGEYLSERFTPFTALKNGAVAVNGGSLTGAEGAVTAPAGNGTIVVTDGHLTGLDNFAVATNGSEGAGGNIITIKGGLLEGNIKSAGYEAIGIYIANSDTFVMTGGEVIAHGGTGLCMRAGNVTISGGKITATNVDKNGNIVADGQIADDPTIMTGCSAVIYHESANYPGKAGMRLAISGGTITGVDHSVEVLSNEAEPQVFVTGGTLTPAYA